MHASTEPTLLAKLPSEIETLRSRVVPLSPTVVCTPSTLSDALKNLNLYLLRNFPVDFIVVVADEDLRDGESCPNNDNSSSLWQYLGISRGPCVGLYDLSYLNGFG